MSVFALKVPSLGEGVYIATIQSWLKQPGDFLQEGEVFVELSTDKVDSEVPSPVSGYVRMLTAKPEDQVSVGDVIAYVTDIQDEDVSHLEYQNSINPMEIPNNLDRNHVDDGRAIFSESDNDRSSQVAKTHNIKNEKVVSNVALLENLSPYVRSLILKHSISYAEFVQIHPTSAGGRITAKDVEIWLKNKNNTNADISEKNLDNYDSSIKCEPLSTERQNIARNLLEAVSNIPHVTTALYVDFSHILRMKMRLKKQASQFSRELPHITISSFIAYALVQALKEHPIVNAVCDGANVFWRDAVHLGCAVATDENRLLIPVIRDAHKRSFFALARALHDVIERSRCGSLSHSELVGGTFSFSNPAMYGCEQSTAIIHRNQSAIFAVGKMISSWQPVLKKEVAVLKNVSIDCIPFSDITGLSLKQISHCALTFDHRLFDGKTAGLFLRSFKQYMENGEFDEASSFD